MDQHQSTSDVGTAKPSQVSGTTKIKGTRGTARTLVSCNDSSSLNHGRRGSACTLAATAIAVDNTPSSVDLFGEAPPPIQSIVDFPKATGRAPPNGQTAIVIGAGVGGLAMAGRLAREGFDVQLLEKNLTSGGRMRSEMFSTEPGLEGHRFDTGPTLLLFPDKYREAFAALGANMDDYVKLARVEPTAMRVHFAEDWSTLDLLSDKEAMVEQLEEVERGAGKQYLHFLGQAEASLELGVKAFIEQESKSVLDFLDIRRVGPLALAVPPWYLLGPQTWQLSAHFTSEKIKALFSYQHLYVGLSPQNAPGVFSLLAATELTDGIWYPKGGFGTVRDGLVDICEQHGVVTRLGAEVEAIIVDEGKDGGSAATRTSRGVRLQNGEELRADVVVANPDLPYVYDKLLAGQYKSADNEAAKMRDDLDYSCGMIEFCWALSEPLPQLAQHNVFLGADYEGSWDRPCTVADLRNGHSFNFYVHHVTATDDSAAPHGEDNIMVEFPIGNAAERKAAAAKAGLASMESDEELVAAAREAVISQFERMGYGAVRGGGMTKIIKGERLVTPADWERRYNLTHGATFGLSHGITQLACFRPPRQTGIPGVDAQKVDGLHFVGASTRPGNGVPLVLMGVATTFDNIVAEQASHGSPRA